MPVSPTLTVPPPCPLPEARRVAELLDGLLEASVDVEPVPVRERSAEWAGLVAPLVKDNGILAAAMVADAAFAARAGAAVRLEPVESAAEPELDPDAVEAAGEVLDGVVAAFNSATTPHVALDGCHQLPGSLPPGVEALLRYPYRERELRVRVGDYGSGRLTVLIW